MLVVCHWLYALKDSPSSISKALDGICGGTIVNSSGYISAPDFDADGYYDFNLNCYWLIKVATNSTIVHQLMNLEIEETATGCDADYLYVSNKFFLIHGYKSRRMTKPTK